MGYSPRVGGAVQSEHERQDKGELSPHGSVEQTNRQPQRVSDTAEQFSRVTWKAVRGAGIWERGCVQATDLQKEEVLASPTGREVGSSYWTRGQGIWKQEGHRGKEKNI